jgi:hypothetical protein
MPHAIIRFSILTAAAAANHASELLGPMPSRRGKRFSLAQLPKSDDLRQLPYHRFGLWSRRVPYHRRWWDDEAQQGLVYFGLWRLFLIRRRQTYILQSKDTQQVAQNRKEQCNGSEVAQRRNTAECCPPAEATSVLLLASI